MAEEHTETEAAENVAKRDAAADVRRWLLTHKAATLCTTAAKPDLLGWPFGSIVPFALTGDGRPFILIARIAAHTANLERDDRATLFVSEPGLQDPQAGWRIGVMGRMKRLVTPSTPRAMDERSLVITEQELEELRARYLERVPSGERYEATHDFDYWRMDSITKVRYIAGFGEIAWLDGSAVLRDALGAGLRETMSSAIEHLNQNHSHNLVELCSGLAGVTVRRARAVAIDRTGLMLRSESPERLLHFSFGTEISARDLRSSVVSLIEKARAKLTDSESGPST
ncbi:MAG: pyridoxamine 5'-phosphate oxidase family protein [Deltaproteobacteria bacterium]|nr:pyridoxamine 5'-phosphate oxidase family protein [Deltaproteobacteria bacterium]